MTTHRHAWWCAGPAAPPSCRVRCSLGFSAIALINVSVLSVLRPYLTTTFEASSTDAGVLTSAVAIASVPGSVVAGVLLRRGVSPLLLGSAGLLCPVLAFVTFTAAELPVVVTAAALLVFAVGVGVAGLTRHGKRIMSYREFHPK